jgi:hypothetical protein
VFLRFFPHHRVLLALISIACLGFWPHPAHSAWMIPNSPYRPKDFAFIKRDGLYHLFYIRNNPTLPADQTQMDLGHATSKDLYFWTQYDSILPVRPGMFDRSHVWAPSIIQIDSVYYMFYTGVSDTPDVHVQYQQIGVATSLDLWTWNRLDDPVLNFTQVPWAVGDSTLGAPFRDPFVMADPTSPGRWLMAYTTAPASDSGGQIVGLAGSDGDLLHWQDLGGIWVTQRSWTFNDQTESPHFFEHNGLWYLFYTTSSGQPITFATTTDLFADPPGWIYRGRLGTMLGNNTLGWFASEYLRDGLVEYFAFVNGDRVDIERMLWSQNWQFTLAQPDLFHVQKMTWSATAIRGGQSADLTIESVWWMGQSAAVESFWLDDAGDRHPVSNALIGLPDHIVLSGPMNHYNWSAPVLPESLGAPSPVRILVRLVDQTVSADPILLMPPIVRDPGLGPPDPTGEPEPGGVGAGPEEFGDPGPNPILRTLNRGIYGSLPSMVVDMPASEAVRLDIFDLQGRRLRTLVDRVLPRGATVLAWDGRDASGLRAPRGIYFARLATTGRVRSVRLLLR